MDQAGERLKELERAGRRPNVKSVKAKDVVAALGKLRELLQGDVGVAAQVLKALVGDVVIETRQVEGQEKPQMVARFMINAVPALAVLDHRGPMDLDGVPVPVWDSINSSPGSDPATSAAPAEAIVPLVYGRKAAARKAAKPRWSRMSGAGEIAWLGCQSRLGRGIPAMGRCSARLATGSIEV